MIGSFLRLSMCSSNAALISSKIPAIYDTDQGRKLLVQPGYGSIGFQKSAAPSSCTAPIRIPGQWGHTTSTVLIRSPCLNSSNSSLSRGFRDPLGNPMKSAFHREERR